MRRFIRFQRRRGLVSRGLSAAEKAVKSRAILPGRLADVAQLVEHFTRNEGVPGSSPGVGFDKIPAQR